MFSDCKRYIFLILMLGWMCTIFWFSGVPADESTEMSHSVGQFVGEVFVPGFKEWDEVAQEAFAAKIDHPVRKSAHACEYAILGMLVFGFLSAYNIEKTPSLSWIVSALYAASDEFHQLFVQGRSGQISDVALDSVGALAGIVILGIIIRRLKRTFS